MQCTKLVDYATKRPNVTFLIVFLIMNLFRRHVVRSTNVGEGKLRFLVHNSCETEVPQFNITIPVQENISWLQISMQYFLW